MRRSSTAQRGHAGVLLDGSAIDQQYRPKPSPNTREDRGHSSRPANQRRYFFFGLTKHVFENYCRIPSSYVVFICGDPSDSFVVPAQSLYSLRDGISRNAVQYKLIIRDGSLDLPRSRDSAAFDLKPFHNRFEPLARGIPRRTGAKLEREAGSGSHTDAQGLLLEIGKCRGRRTYCADRAKRYGGKTLGSLASLSHLPPIPGIPAEIASRVDVIWLDHDDLPVDALGLSSVQEYGVDLSGSVNSRVHPQHDCTSLPGKQRKNLSGASARTSSARLSTGATILHLPGFADFIVARRLLPKPAGNSMCSAGGRRRLPLM